MQQTAPSHGLPFIKMHGLGNDFVVLDARAGAVTLAPEEVRAIADRRLGIGCDQVILLTNDAGADAAMEIHNADGGSVEACGNASRCVAMLIMNERGADTARLGSPAGVLDARRAGARDRIALTMRPPRFGWRDIALTRAVDSLHLPLTAGPLSDGVAVNIGNPHAVFFVDDAEAIDLAALGPVLEHDPLFARRANISVATVSDGAIRLRVWERGAGLTPACGTGACAAMAAAVRRGLIGATADVVLDGGSLRIDWPGHGPLVMTGPAVESFRGFWRRG